MDHEGGHSTHESQDGRRTVAGRSQLTAQRTAQSVAAERR
jgi:hypothetical protein